MWRREHDAWGAYYSVAGQRIDANNFTVDGISANPGGFHHNARPNIRPATEVMAREEGKPVTDTATA
jgi:hypothetical protein